MSEIKNIMDALGRSRLDGNVRGEHLGQVLTYLEQHKTEKLKSTVAKLGLILGIGRRYLKENYIEGLAEFGVIKVVTLHNESVWNWVGERAFDCYTGKEESVKDYVERKEKEKKGEKTE